MKKSILLLLMVLTCTFVSAQVQLPELVSDGMVLQQGVPLKIWGWASPKEKVTVGFKGKEYSVLTSAKGKWRVELPKQKAGGPYSISIKGKNEIMIKDVLIGEVWLCSGQSNMELPIRRVLDLYADEVAQINNDNIREFRVPKEYDFNVERENTTGARWYKATSESIMEFSAMAYFFAEKLNHDLDVPVGLINAALGGSPVEAWINEEYLKRYDEAYQELLKYKDDDFVQSVDKENKQRYTIWHNKVEPNDKGNQGQIKWSSPKLDDTNWKAMDVPQRWHQTELEKVNGSIWFRKNIKLDQSMTGKEGMMEMGCIVDADSVFINGEFVGRTTYQYPPRKYKIPASLLKEGENTIAIKVLSQMGVGGFVPQKNYWIEVEGKKISLEGEWKYNIGCIVPPMKGETFIRWKPAGLHNAMISPLRNYAIKGVLWYQGESNIGTKDYADRLSNLMANWREEWGQGSFPFVIIQLPNFLQASDEPTESAWAEMRAAQYQAAQQNENAISVTTIDLGEWNDIHPLNKKDVGYRTELAALHLAYGVKNIHSGPMCKKIKAKGNMVELSFAHVGSGLVTKGDALQGFAIAGEDEKYEWAIAIIKGNKVQLTSPSIKVPKHVRYAWADNPDKANLYNKEGLPAVPFHLSIDK